jgi:hypothetical protein
MINACQPSRNHIVRKKSASPCNIRAVETPCHIYKIISYIFLYHTVSS